MSASAVHDHYAGLVRRGEYRPSDPGLHGRKDNVRRYWEDIATKLLVRDCVQSVLSRRGRLRVADLGCGSGEGLELLLKLPPQDATRATDREFVLAEEDIERYVGLDLSPSMVREGSEAWPSRPWACFEVADLSRPVEAIRREPFDLYFTSYGSMSHLAPDALESLVEQVAAGMDGHAYLVIDVLGRHSPEWPERWDDASPSMHPYTMGYLIPPPLQCESIADWFEACYWMPDEIRACVTRAAGRAGASATVVRSADRSVLVGRHMDTPFFRSPRQQLRHQVNRLFSRDYRGQSMYLRPDLSGLDPSLLALTPAGRRIAMLANHWNEVTSMLEALMRRDHRESARLVAECRPPLRQDLQAMEWLFTNATRFPVADFWASVMGPQVGCLLRNAELSAGPATGAGHGLIMLVELRR